MALIRPLLIACFVLACQHAPHALAQPQTPPDERPADDVKRGLILSTEAAATGYTLFAPLNSTTTYLIDIRGETVHSWPSEYNPGQAVYVLDDGRLLRCERQPRNRHFHGGGIGGRVERISPDGKVEWEFVYANEEHCLHHDVEPLPNGNILMIAWEKKTRDEAIAAGRDPKLADGEVFWPDFIIEVRPEGASGGKIVWEWHVWDHLVQDFDKSKPNFGVVADHPQRVNVNFRGMPRREGPAGRRFLRALGYLGGGDGDEDDDADDDSPRRRRADDDADGRPRGPRGPDMRADWCHTNSIAYNARLDQIVLSVHNFNEIWIIDHTTTTKEAAGHTGGRYGKGGDLLYRWGNPRAYGAGDAKDQQIFAQHDAQWVPDGTPGAGHLLVFNNGLGRPDGAYSSVVELAPPMDATGVYARQSGKAFGPDKPSWEYAAEQKRSFFSSHISGTQRLPNGNTLICSGEQGRIFEVTPAGKSAWEYVNPYLERSGPDDGDGPPGRRRPRRPDRDDPDGRPPENAEQRERPEGSVDPQDADRDPARADDSGPRPADGERRGPWGPPGAWAGPGGPRGGLFRATRLPPDHPGLRHILRQATAAKDRQP